MNKYFILGLLFSFLSCEKEKTYCGCGSEYPTVNIEWLNSSINHYENDKNHNWSLVNLYMYDYNNSNAFIFEAKEIGLSISQHQYMIARAEKYLDVVGYKLHK